jgi:hypothetical protein
MPTPRSPEEAARQNLVILVVAPVASLTLTRDLPFGRVSFRRGPS